VGHAGHVRIVKAWPAGGRLGVHEGSIAIADRASADRLPTSIGALALALAHLLNCLKALVMTAQKNELNSDVVNMESVLDILTG